MSSSPARSVYIASPEGHTGKSVVALGLVDLLARRVRNVGVFRPITRSTAGDDQVVKLLLEQVGADLSYESCVGVTYEDVHADPDAALATIVERYRAIERVRGRGRRRLRLHRRRRSDRAHVQCPCCRQSGRAGAARRERVRADARRCRPGRRDRHRRARPGARRDGRCGRQPVRSVGARRCPRPVVRVRPADVGIARDAVAVGTARCRT